ncbi:hypothetical protein Pcac1_g17307 [Phytophthora cactorum]|nr:hypothetical protein Pcac1_g17307 [Phytophthora cactorum]
MAEAPGQKRKHDKAPGARKRRRVRSSLEGAPTETASALGGVEVFKDVWGWLVKAGWTSKRPFSKSLDSRYKYVRPGGRHNDNEGGDYLLGELAVLRYVENMRVSEVAAEQANQSTSEGEGAADIVVLSDLVVSLTLCLFVAQWLASDGLSVRQSSLSTASTEPASRKLEARPEQQVQLADCLGYKRL